MNRAEITQALQIAKSNEDLQNVDDTVLNGCALPNFKPVIVTLRTVARFLRWQVICLNGEVDTKELNNLSWILKNRVQIVG